MCIRRVAALLLFTTVLTITVYSVETCKRKQRIGPPRKSPKCHSDEWTQNDRHGSCYLVSSMQLTWQQAQDWCMKLNGALAVIESGDENKYLYNLGKDNLSEFPAAGKMGPWIGLSRDNPTKHWVWQLDTGKRARFYDLLGIFPETDEERYPLCAHFSGSHKPYQWGRFPCHAAMYFICEYKFHLKLA